MVHHLLPFPKLTFSVPLVLVPVLKMSLRVVPLLRIVHAITNVVLNLADPGVYAAVRNSSVDMFKLSAIPEGLAALDAAPPGSLHVLAMIGFGRVGKSTTLNAFLAILC